MKIPENVIKNRFSLCILSEKNYMDHLKEVIRMVVNKKKKICYVCVARPYEDVLNELKDEGIDESFLIFVDTLSSYYVKPEPKRNCIFVDSPYNLEMIEKSVKIAIEKGGCRVLIFDSLSSLMFYSEKFQILKFLNSINLGKDSANGIYIILKENSVLKDDSKKFTDDLRMFADKIFELG